MIFTSTRFFPIVILLIAQAAIGAAALMARAGLENGLSALSLAAWRLLLASVLMAVGTTLFRRRASLYATALTRREIVLLCCAGACLGLHFVTWFLSLQTISIARSTLLVTTSPLFTGLLAMLWKRQRMSAGFWWGLLVAGIGVIGVTQGGEFLQKSPATTLSIVSSPTAPLLSSGDGLALVGAICIAVYYLLVQEVQPHHDTARIIGWTYPVSALALFPFALFVDGLPRFIPDNPAAWFAVFGMAIIPQLVGHTALNWSLRHFPAGVVGAATLLEPVFAGVLAWVLFGETFSAGQGMAMVVVLCGIALTIVRGRVIS